MLLITLIISRFRKFISTSYEPFLDSFRIFYAQVPDCVYGAVFAVAFCLALERAIPKLLIV
jgi:hypothetical protein